MTAAFAVVRGLHFASLMTVFGAASLMFQARNVANARWRQVLAIAAAVALATAVASLLFVTEEMAGGAAAVGAVVEQSFYGRVFLVRFFLLLSLCGLCLIERPFAQAFVAASALALLGLSSHAAAAGDPAGFSLRAGVDAAHLLAAGFWVGGLAVLVPEVLARPRDMQRLTALLRLFSRWGVVSVAVLVAAGAANGVFILGGVARWSGPYVTWLALKIVLAALMVALALTNRFGVLPGLERGDKEAGDTIPLTVLAELGCAVLILVIVGFLGLMPPMAM